MFFPPELLELRQWCLAARKTKYPFSAVTGQPIKHDGGDELIYASQYTEEQKAKIATGEWAVGFVLQAGLGITVIDIDGKNYEQDTERFNKLIKLFNSYTEISQSGKGFHIWCKGEIEDGGRRFNQLELYSDKRFIMVTGNIYDGTVRNVENRQKILDELIATAPRSAYAVEAQDIEVESHKTDDQIYMAASTSTNGSKFVDLYEGRWRDHNYPSQSEADHALIEMLCFHTPSNNQVRNLFFHSKLYRTQSNKGAAYISRSIIASRNRQKAEQEFLKVLPQNLLPQIAEIRVQREEPVYDPSFAWPPGFLGELAREMNERSVNKIPEVAVTAALAILSGFCGASYVTEQEGHLNNYFIVLSKSAIGKEGLFKVTDVLAKQIELHPNLHSLTRCNIRDYVDKSKYVSAQALAKAMRAKPSFASFNPEFGEEFEIMCSEKNDSKARDFRRLLLTAFNAGYLGDIVYSNKENNVEGGAHCALTIVGDSVGSTLFDKLNDRIMKGGFLSRFTFIEYEGEQQESNGFNRQPFPDHIIERLCKIMEHCNTLAVPRGTKLKAEPHMIPFGEGALDYSKAFWRYQSKKLHGIEDEAIRQKWARQHEKGLKVAGVLAVAEDHVNPIMTVQHLKWAFDLQMRSLRTFERREEVGELGELVNCDIQMARDVKRIVVNHLQRKEQYKDEVIKLLADHNIVPYAIIQRKLASYASYRNARNPNVSFKNTLDDLISSGVIKQCDVRGMQGFEQKTGKYYQFVGEE